ncbi:polysaccharide biosynthesis protein [Polynucleobacter paneuropaeus]|nr:polysaccharide biosynthesis protein [Polynucleobacter paneuropaeus]
MALNKLSNAALKLPRFSKRLIVLLTDIGMSVISVVFAFYLRLGEWIFFFPTNGEYSIGIATEVAVLLAIPIFIFSGLYREIFRYSGWFALLTLTRAMALYGVAFFSIFGLIGIGGVPRTIGLIQPIILLMLVGASRAFASFWLGNSYRRQLKISAVPKVFIYGAGSAGMQLAAALAHSFEMQVVGFIDDDVRLHGSVMSGRRIFSPEKLKELVISHEVSGVLLALPSASRFRRNQIIELVRDARVSVQTLPSVSDLAHGKVTTEDLRSLDIDDLLSRDPVLPNSELLTKNCKKKSVMVTGAGGSIGSELCRQIALQDPTLIVLVEQNEYALYKIHQELVTRIENIGDQDIRIIPVIASVTNFDLMNLVVKKWKPHIIYHAAAYKHVPLVEANPVEGIRNNVFGTLALAEVALKHEIPNFVLISTDKAVRPTNVMGASKRLAEMVLQAISKNSNSTRFSMVRFGNVLNSSGSVVPKFRQQIRDGGPVTVTDFRMTRYFMTIPEAAQLVIQAGALATGGDVFLLDMGEPVKIYDLARRMIELSGLDVKEPSNLDGDIEIKEIGLRPGEKLYEELLIDGSPEKTLHPRIFKSHEDYLQWDKLSLAIQNLQKSILSNNDLEVSAILGELVVGYVPATKVDDLDG